MRRTPCTLLATPMLLALATLAFVPLSRVLAQPPTRGTVPALTLHRTRQADDDLELSGMLPGLPAGTSAYVSYAALTTLPQVTARVIGDENFPTPTHGPGVLITGIPLELLAHALGTAPASDLIDALCTDDYRAYYPAGYLAAHHPILALTIEHQRPAAWAARTHQYDPSPYFITHAHFLPGERVLTHSEQPQIPTNVIRLNFSTTAQTFGAIAPRGTYAPGSPVAQGFAIAKQNCLRCHFQGAYGGTKSGRDWLALSTWAGEQPAFFAGYVHDPQAFEPHAHMPANPRYDRATLSALTAYFQTFTAGNPAPAAK